MTFEFATAQRIVFGPGTSRDLPKLFAGEAEHAFVVTGSHPERYASITPGGSAVFRVTGEPSFDTIRHAVAEARSSGCDGVIGIGGGSALDAAKAVAMLLANGGDPLDYAEVIGKGKPVSVPSVPCICVPTTSGTGSEATRNAVLTSPEHRVKVSLRSPLMLPRIALVDPELTLGLPRDVSAATGMDALSQLIEAFVSVRANPMTDALCREGLQRAARSLRKTCDQPGDLAAREDMAMASLFSGIALANAGLGAVHGLAAPLGGLFNAPHGTLCAALLGRVMAANVAALPQSDPLRARFREVALLLTGRPAAQINDGISWVRELTASLGIPGLRAMGVDESRLDEVAEAARKSSSMKGNPVKLSNDVLKGILADALL